MVDFVCVAEKGNLGKLLFTGLHHLINVPAADESIAVAAEHELGHLNLIVDDVMLAEETERGDIVLNQKLLLVGIRV